MDFSDQWNSLWPVSSTFPAPNLISGAASKPLGPLLFRPSPPSPPLLSSPSLALQIPPPIPHSSLSVHAFFRSSTDAFIPSAVQDSLVADLVSSLPADPIATNNLHALRCRDGSTLALFFPAGENADWIGYLSLSFRSGSPAVVVDQDGDVFKQQEGFKHPCHRILKMSVAPAPASDMEVSGNPTFEGFLIAATLYSVNWFRVETRVLDSGQERPFLVPVAKQGFKSSVVHACWSPHFPEESAVLLDNGDLCLFNVNTMSCSKIRVTLAGDDPEEWLSCEFGGQPWILFVACSTAVVLVDLRAERGIPPKYLARTDMLNLYCITPSREKNDRLLAFCKAGYDDFHIAVVSENQLLLFDTRQPLLPLLRWDHGLDRPVYVTMFRLSELRPLSDEFKWASESGFAILVGSFWNDEFSLFCYGPQEGGAHNSSLFYAWELPSCIPLSGRQCGSGDISVHKCFSEKELPDCSGWQRKDMVAGFCMVPENFLKPKSYPTGFALVRLMLSGKLEMQSYHASWDSFSDELKGKDEDLVGLNDLPICCTNQESGVSVRYSFIKLQYLYEHMNGNLSNALAMHGSQSHCREMNKKLFSRDLLELSEKLNSSSSSVSSFLSDAGIPTSIFEIASRRVLIGLPSEFLPLAFSKYSDLFGSHGNFPFEFLEVPFCLPHHKLPPFFVVKPSRRSEKWTKKAPPGEALIGPVLPLPVLLALQEMDNTKNCPSFLNDEPHDDLMTRQCKTVLDNVFPEISIADTGNGWDGSQEMHEDMPFFVYDPTQMSNRLNCNIHGSTATCAMKEKVPQMDILKPNLSVPDAANEDKKFTTFICGVAEKTSSLNSDNKPVNLEMLNLSPVKLDFDSSTTNFQPGEQQIYKCLKKQFASWQDNYKPYQDFCASSKIP